MFGLNSTPSSSSASVSSTNTSIIDLKSDNNNNLFNKSIITTASITPISTVDYDHCNHYDYEKRIFINSPSTYVPLSKKITNYCHSSHGGIPFFSVEFFPPRSDKTAGNLIRLLDKYCDGDPYYANITWHAAGQSELDNPTSSITVAGMALNYCCLDTMLHIICISLTCANLRHYLERAKRLGIRNILALRGDKIGKQ